MSDVLPKNAIVKVTLEIRVPCEASYDEIEEWLRFSLGHNGSCSNKNPLVNESPETFGTFGFDMEFTGYTGRYEIYDRQKTETGETYRRKSIRERVAQ